MASPTTAKKMLRFPSGLYGVTPEWNDAKTLEQAVRAAARGGMRALQFRHKSPDRDLRKELAQGLATLCRELNVTFFINDDWRLALELKADGIHLGQHDDPPARVRAEVGPDMLMGVSCYANSQLAQQLLQHDVSYIAFGAMYASQAVCRTAPGCGGDWRDRTATRASLGTGRR